MTEPVGPNPKTRAMVASPSGPGGADLPRRLAWIMLFRSVVVFALLASTVAIRLGTGANVLGLAPLVVYAGCGISYLAIGAGALWLRVFGNKHALGVTYLQLIADLTVTSLLAAATGGIESGFVFLYFLNVIVAAVLLRRRYAILIAVACSAAYGAVFFVQWLGWLTELGTPRTDPTQVVPYYLSNVLGMLLITVLAGYLTEQLRQTSESLTEAQKHLFHLEELQAAMLSSLPLGVVTVDDRQRVVYINDAGARILGGSSEEIENEPVGEIFPGLPLAGPAVDGMRFESPMINVGGVERVLGGSLAQLTGVTGLAGKVVVFQDLTELRKLQQELGRADRLATVGRFAAGVAHEIRNPLAAMIGCLELIQSSDKSSSAEEEERLLGIVLREAERLSRLVSDFLTYARPPEPKPVYQRLRELAEDVIDAARVAHENIHFELVFQSDPEVDCDAEQIRQVLWNLVNNAIREVRQNADARKPQIRITIEEDSKFAMLSVGDSGAGIPEENIERLFEPFFTTSPDGTGLGLATSRQILLSHDGSLSVGKSPLGGAKFVASLKKRDSYPVILETKKQQDAPLRSEIA